MQITSGNPLGTLYWTFNNSVVKTSTSSTVTYSFKPSTDQNLEEFSCAANNSVLSQRNIRICLYLPPTVQITPGRFVSVVEGTQRELKCIFSSNNEVKNISWVYNDKPLQKWFNCSRIQLVNVNQSQGGEYVCTVTNQAGSVTATVTITVLRRPAAPKNIQTVALTHEIIVKWFAGHADGLRQEFFIEYRKTFDTMWQILSAGTTSTLIISNLEPDTVYVIRIYSKTVAGESNRTDEIILATDKRGSEGTLVLAVIPGVISLLFILLWFGIKGFNNRCCFNRNMQSTPQENETTSVMQRTHYDEIDSLYYNPMNDIITRQGVIQNQQETSRHVDIVHSRFGLHNHSISHEIDMGADYSLNIFQGNLSGQSSSDESYLVPFQHNIVAEGIVNKGLNENQGEQLDFDIDDLSVASESSETNAKSVKKYEKLLTVDTAEHSYT